MRHANFFKILQTTSSEVSCPDLFQSWTTIYIPDLFVALLSLTLLGFAVCLDLFLVFFLIFNGKRFVAFIFAISLCPHSICELLFDRKKANEFASNFIQSRVFFTTIYIFGFGSIFMTSRILIKIFPIAKTETKPFFCFPHPFFHISPENLSTMKIYNIIHLVFKSIPHLLIVPVFILERCVTGVSAILLGVNILLNILIFCQVMATTFPIRKTPRVFTNSTCILFNALNKFMATMCACCINLTVFAVVFKRHKYYAFLGTLFKSVLWVIPCCRTLRAQPIPITKFCFAVYFICISLVFGFIYIHPFEGVGKLYYYLFYLLEFMYELFVIYLVADANLESISYYLTLKILLIGFLSCFGLLNILHKYRVNKFKYVRGRSVEVMNTEYNDVENNEDQKNVKSSEDKENKNIENEVNGNVESNEVNETTKNGENEEEPKNKDNRDNIKLNPRSNPKTIKPKRNAEDWENMESV